MRPSVLESDLNALAVPQKSEIAEAHREAGERFGSARG